MEKREEQLLQQAADARLVHLNEQLVFPLLERNIETTLIAMCHQLKTTGVADIGKLAYIAACKDLGLELKQLAQRGDRAVVRLDDHRNKI